MKWIRSRQFAWFEVSVSVASIALALVNLTINTAHVDSWLPLLVIMLLPLHQGIRTLRSRPDESGQGMLMCPEPDLEDGERVVLRTPANWSRSGIARGGMLLLTNRRLIFEPNSIEASIGLVSSAWLAGAITQIEVARRGWNPLSGAVRRRLLVSFTDGTSAHFVVPEVDQLSDRMAAQLSQ